MTQRKALKALATLVVISLVLILFNFAFKRAKPELYLDANRESPEELAIARHALLDNLEITGNEPNTADLNDRGVLAWPAGSTIKEFHKTDLSIFQGKSKNDHALVGVLVFIDAGDVTEPDLAPVPGQMETAPEQKRNIAPTDPVTGLPISTYRNLVTEPNETTQVSEQFVGASEMLGTVEKRLKTELEQMGAKVFLTREAADSSSEIAQQAYIANHIGQVFLSELQELKFRSIEVEQMIPNLVRAIDEPNSPEARKIFTSNGISPQLRILLDVERQYKEVIYISLRLGETPEEEAEAGARVYYYGSQSAAGFGAGSYSEDRPQDQPAYVSYDTSSRRSLAERINNNFKEYLPEMLYQSSTGAVSERAVISGRYNNLTSVEVMIGEIHHEENYELLSKESNLNRMADAISTSIYEFFTR